MTTSSATSASAIEFSHITVQDYLRSMPTIGECYALMGYINKHGLSLSYQLATCRLICKYVGSIKSKVLDVYKTHLLNNKNPSLKTVCNSLIYSGQFSQKLGEEIPEKFEDLFQPYFTKMRAILLKC